MLLPGALEAVWGRGGGVGGGVEVEELTEDDDGRELKLPDEEALALKSPLSPLCFLSFSFSFLPSL